MATLAILVRVAKTIGFFVFGGLAETSGTSHLLNTNRRLGIGTEQQKSENGEKGERTRIYHHCWRIVVGETELVRAIKIKKYIQEGFFMFRRYRLAESTTRKTCIHPSIVQQHASLQSIRTKELL